MCNRNSFLKFYFVKKLPILFLIFQVVFINPLPRSFFCFIFLPECVITSHYMQLQLPVLHSMINSLIQKVTLEKSLMCLLSKNYSLWRSYVSTDLIQQGSSLPVKNIEYWWKWCKWAKHKNHTQRKIKL